MSARAVAESGEESRKLQLMASMRECGGMTPMIVPHKEVHQHIKAKMGDHGIKEVHRAK